MNRQLELRLKVLRDFQQKYPESHVGGSIGLLIRGIDLKRDLGLSDLDITVPEDNIIVSEIDNASLRSDGNDFEYAIMIQSNNSQYVKVDIRVCPEPSFEIVYFENDSYNVSKLKDIIFWKRKYATKGVQKHIDDLLTINTGIRPVASQKPVSANDPDDLPF